MKRKRTRWLVPAYAGVLLLALVPATRAEQRVVSAAELQQAARAQAAENAAQRERLQAFFAGEQGRQALAKMKLDLRQVQQAVAQLSEEEAAAFAEQAEQAERDFAAGDLTNKQITYILIALATAVIVLILV